jgi:hypothetical protein
VPPARTKATAANVGQHLFFFGNQFHYPLHGEKARFGLKAAARPVSNSGGATSYSFKAQSRTSTQRVWRRSRGTVRTIHRRSFVFHASLPVNRGYDPYQQTARGEWAKAEESLLEGSRRLTPLSRWVPSLVTQVEQCSREVGQCRRDVSGLPLADEADRDGLVGPVLPSLRSVGCYAGKT